MTDKAQQHRPIRSFGRVRGRSLSARQEKLIEDALPKLAVPEMAAGALDPATLFDQLNETWLEIGFGGGEHLIGQATANPDIGFIGCEPFVDGMAKALTEVTRLELSNIRLHMDDVRPLIATIADQTIDRVFILFPDPWPKKKQRKRRLVQPEFVAELARICRPDAKLRFATDIMSYADEALATILNHGGFDWIAETVDDWRLPAGDHLQTRYEAKKLGDCAPVWFDFARNKS